MHLSHHSVNAWRFEIEENQINQKINFVEYFTSKNTSSSVDVILGGYVYRVYFGTE